MVLELCSFQQNINIEVFFFFFFFLGGGGGGGGGVWGGWGFF
jgi:hypothetical protein